MTLPQNPYFTLCGYTKELETLYSLQQVTITASPQSLRRLAAFITACADSMEQSDEFSHTHFLDYIHCKENFPDLIVMGEEKD